MLVGLVDDVGHFLPAPPGSPSLNPVQGRDPFLTLDPNPWTLSVGAVILRSRAPLSPFHIKG